MTFNRLAHWPRTDKLLLALVLAGIVALVALLFLIGQPSIQSLDETIVRMLRTTESASEAIGPKWFLESARDYTALGGYSVLMLLTSLVWLFLRLEQRRTKARFVLAVILSGYVMSMALKEAVGRARPSVVPHLSHVERGSGSHSFPSGHSTMSTVVYVTLALMLSELSSRRLVRAFLIVAPLSIAAAVGASRVLMGVHYPTDVLAGWAVGLSWSLGAWLIVRRWRNEIR